MTSHPDDGLLQELVDGEIPSDRLAPILAHLDACEPCRARFARARHAAADVDGLLELLDEPELESAPVVPPPVARPLASRRRARWVVPVSWAASLVLATGAGYVARDTLRGDVAGDPPPERATVDAGIAAPPPAPLGAAPTTPEREAPRRAAPAATSRREPDLLADRAARKAPPAEAGIAAELAAPPPAAASLPAPVVAGAQKAIGDTALRQAPPPVATFGATATARDRAAARSAALGAATADALRERRTAATATRPLAPVPQRLDAVSDSGLTLAEATLRLGRRPATIEGLPLLRIAPDGAEIRMVYRVTGGDLLLAQAMRDGALVWRLIPPAGYPADSLEAMRRRVRE